MRKKIGSRAQITDPALPLNENVFAAAGLAKPAQRALNNAGIATFTQLAAYSENEIAQLHGIGKNALVQLTKAMLEQGLAFRKH